MKNKFKKIKDLTTWNSETIGIFFLGVGLSTFILTIIVFINISQFYSGNNILNGFFITIVSSIILMSYSIYNMYNKNYD